MGSQFIVLTPPAQEPLLLPDVKAYLRIDFDDDDVLLSLLLRRARSYAETVTGRAWANQQIQQLYTIQRPSGGELSGPINRGPDWYAYQQMIGANPFGAAQFYMDLAMPPFDATKTLTMETRVTAFDVWQTFPQVTNPDGSVNVYVDTIQEPNRLFLKDPLTVNFWRFTFWCGYGASTYPLPLDLQQLLFEMCGFLYDNREGQDFPQSIINRLLAKRVSWTGL